MKFLWLTDTHLHAIAPIRKLSFLKNTVEQKNEAFHCIKGSPIHLFNDSGLEKVPNFLDDNAACWLIY